MAWKSIMGYYEGASLCPITGTYFHLIIKSWISQNASARKGWAPPPPLPPQNLVGFSRFYFGARTLAAWSKVALELTRNRRAREPRRLTRDGDGVA